MIQVLDSNDYKRAIVVQTVFVTNMFSSLVPMHTVAHACMPRTFTKNHRFAAQHVTDHVWAELEGRPDVALDACALASEQPLMTFDAQVERVDAHVGPSGDNGLSTADSQSDSPTHNIPVDAAATAKAAVLSASSVVSWRRLAATTLAATASASASASVFGGAVPSAVESRAMLVLTAAARAAAIAAAPATVEQSVLPEVELV